MIDATLCIWDFSNKEGEKGSAILDLSLVNTFSFSVSIIVYSVF